jgi:site-specific recombinase XerC
VVPLLGTKSRGFAANANRVTVKYAVDTYLAQKASKAPNTVLQYKRTLSEFLEALATCKVRYLDEITEAVLRTYKAFIERNGYAGKTIDTRMNIAYFKKNDKPYLPRDEMPIVEEDRAVPCTKEELPQDLRDPL